MAHCFTRLVFKGGVRHELTTVGHLSLNRWGLYGLMGGAFLTKWVGLGSYGKVSCCFLWKYDAGLRGLSSHRMTTGFGYLCIDSVRMMAVLLLWLNILSV